MKKRCIYLLIIACFMVFIFSSCRNANRQHKKEEFPYKSFEEMPGITQNDIEGIKRLQKNGVSFSYAMNNSIEAFVNENNEIEGYSKYFCQWLSDFLGLEFIPTILEEEELMAGLEAKTIDFTGELNLQGKEEERYYKTEAIAERSLKYFILDNGKSLEEIKEEKVPVYGFLKGSSIYDSIVDTSTNEFKTVYVSDYSEAAKLLKDQTIDVFFEEGSAKAGFRYNDNIISKEYYPLIYTSVALATSKEELKPVIDVVEKAISKGAILKFADLYDKGIHDYTSYKFRMDLSQQERRYLEENKQGEGIKVGAEYDNYPISFYNKNEGKWQGIAFDVLAEISEISGLKYQVSNKPNKELKALATELYNGNLDLLTDLVKTNAREESFLWPMEAYCSDNFALLSKSEEENIKTSQIMYEKVALQKDTVYEETFNEWFPGQKNKVIFNSMDECFKAVEAGKVDYVFASKNAMLSMTNYNENPSYKMNIVFDEGFESTFGVRKDEQILTSILTKAQRLIDVETIENHWTHKVYDYRGKLARERIPYLIGVAILLFLLLMLLLNLADKNKRETVKLERLVKQRTLELEKQTRAAKEAAKAKGEFLSKMSHEIRTPLNAIIGMAEIEKGMANLPQKAIASNQEILAASNHLLGLLNDILDMSKIENSDFEIEEKPFVLREAIEEVVSMIYPKCKEKSIFFTTIYEEIPEAVVLGDKLRIKQVLINLLANAIKFTEKNGKIIFTINLKEESEDHIGIHFLVADTGPGVSKEMMDRLFNPFEQGANGILENTGTGLGLSISQNLIKRMGGEIKVETALNQGSNFYFDLDFKKVNQEPLAEEKKPVINLANKNILVAEDVSVNRLIMKELLDKTRGNVVLVEDGLKAIDVFKESEKGYFDIIFMDIQMPRIDGYEAARLIRALERADAKAIPIIAMTAFVYDEDIKKAKDSGMTDHMSKPIDVKKMWEILDFYFN